MWERLIDWAKLKGPQVAVLVVMGAAIGWVANDVVKLRDNTGETLTNHNRRIAQLEGRTTGYDALNATWLSRIETLEDRQASFIEKIADLIARLGIAEGEIVRLRGE